MSLTIQKLAPLLAYQVVDVEIDRQTDNYYQKLVEECAPRLGLYHKYWGLLHDSWFISTKLTKGKFSIRLNDFTTHVFSDVVVARNGLKIDHDKLVFPIEIEFEITNVTYNTIDEDGTIHQIAPTKVHEYLYEQIISVNEDTIDIGLMVWKNRRKNKPGGYILILISAKKCTLREHQDQAWTEIFGNTYDDLYAYFRTQFNAGRYLSDQTVCDTLYSEYELLHRGIE
ncbi:MAG: hypothetical protein U0264_06830 [Candidatus Kapaibacterium sp.]